MKKVITNQWDPAKGNLHLRLHDSDERKTYDIRYTINGICFMAVLREQSPEARYTYRARITAISPLTGNPVKNGKGLKITRSFWTNDVEIESVKDKIAKSIQKLYADNAVALWRAIEENAVLRPETTTPAVAAFRFSIRYEDSLPVKAGKTEKNDHRKAETIKKYFVQLPQKPMGDIEAVEIRRYLNEWKLSKNTHSLLSGFWDYCIKNRYCTGINPFPPILKSPESPESKANKSETPEVLDEKDIDSLFEYLMSVVMHTQMACATALLLWGYLKSEQIQKLTWGDLTFDNDEPDKVIVRLRDDSRSGSTHKLDRPLFPMGGRILHTRYQSLINFGVSEEDLKERKVVARKNDTSIPSGEITRYNNKALKAINLPKKYYSRTEPDKIIAPNLLLENTYKYMVNYICGISDSEPGTAKYLCGESLTGNVTDDRYTSFSSPEGIKRLYAYMHRLCVPEALPKNIVPQLSEDGSTETIIHYPKTTRDRVTITKTVLLQPGEMLVLESPHAGTGIIEAEYATLTGRRRKKAIRKDAEKE